MNGSSERRVGRFSFGFLRCSPLIISGLLSPLLCAADDTEALREQVQRLQERVEALEEETVTAERRGDLGASVSEADVTAAEETDGVHVGGAVRFNLVHRDFVQASQDKYGESGLDVFRLNVDGEVDNILVSAEYRFYSYMHTLHHGWIGYEFDDQSQVQFGIHRVPFGLLPYPAHNAWFGVPYYVGLGDDYDMGLKYERTDGAWNTQLAFYKNEELNDATDPERYSFDLIRGGDQQNEEVNQLNARVAYTFGLGTNCETEVGASAQAGEVYNTTTGRRGDHSAGAAHLDSRCGRWNLQLKGASYEYDPANPQGVDPRTVQVGAFAGTYDIAGEADILVANLAYNLPSPWESVDSITCYNDYSRLYKADRALDSRINTLGCAIGSGPLFTYVDYIMANNMPYFGSGSLAGGGEDEWHSRLNINIGFYW
ncbi:hypothetical protein [Marinimicrobium agarilyticum]|uniref:hypothetical protein n=1 Tax=Marinimicrobium agarilyticum TaxID=306546 RepID=UPI0004070FD8|nr:hypothetical protein [Marinimicrobium agarilyticum]